MTMSCRSYSTISSIIYNVLVKSEKLCARTGLSQLWNYAWEKGCRMAAGPIMTRIHGYEVIVNFGYSYPRYARRFSHFNNPLLELTFQCGKTKQRPITVVDIGAAVGDTALLLQKNCREVLGAVYCIDGDQEFYSYLSSNLARFDHMRTIYALLSSSRTGERNLVRTHRSTASAQGDSRVSATTLDDIAVENAFSSLDLLKIDADGFDGRILAGAKQVLVMYSPSVIFEWHPLLCVKTGNDWREHFTVLNECGYTQFVWFTKYGEFSHFSSQAREQDIASLAEYCLSNTTDTDMHYDVVALPPNSGILSAALADLHFARQCPSKF